MTQQLFLRFLILYIPSFFTRYSIQIMIIGLPWILQMKSVSVISISETFTVFFLGSILTAFFTSSIIAQFDMRKLLLALVLALSILSFLALWIESIEWLYIVRFIQGSFLSILRPLSKIWFLEYDGDRIDSKELSKRSAWSEIVVSIGMSLGAWLGSMFQSFYLHSFSTLVFAAVVCFFPSLVFLFGYLYLLRNNQLVGTSVAEATVKSSMRIGLKDGLKFFLQAPHRLATLFQYCLSLSIFKVWIVGLPYLWRSPESPIAASENGTSVASALPLILTLHPLFFLVGSWFMTTNFFSLNGSKRKKFCFLSVTLVMSGMLVWLAAFSMNWLISGVLVFIGGGLLSAWIYPLCMQVIGDELQNSCAATKRQTMLIFSIAADVGQFVGVMLLSLQILKTVPLGSIVPLLCATLVLSAAPILKRKAFATTAH